VKRHRALLVFLVLGAGGQSAGAQERGRQYTKDEAFSLGIAELSTLLAKEYCSGRETEMASSVYNSAAVQHQRDFAAGQDKVRDRLKPNSDQIKRPLSPTNRAFCDDIVQKYGPRGTIWPGLYQP
jgi:hypothetical protein